MTLPERTITPHSGLEGLRHAVVALIKNGSQARWLAWRFFLRDTRAAHRQSLLGYFWMVVPPLANTLVWVFLNGSQIVKIETGSTPYPVFVLSGTILWGAFNAAVMAMLGVVHESRGVLSKVNFPQESLIYSSLLKASTESVIPLVLMVPALFYYGVSWTPWALLYPVALVVSILTGAAVGLALFPVAALYGDVGKALQLVLRFGFFVTPVIYALPAAGTARSLMLWNPLTPIITSGRAWLCGTGETMPFAFCSLGLAALVCFAAGILVFKITLPHIIERIGS